MPMADFSAAIRAAVSDLRHLDTHTARVACTCGWAENHDTPEAASAALVRHQETEHK
jgi:hypothetical protein